MKEGILAERGSLNESLDETHARLESTQNNLKEKMALIVGLETKLNEKTKENQDLMAQLTDTHMKLKDRTDRLKKVKKKEMLEKRDRDDLQSLLNKSIDRISHSKP